MITIIGVRFRNVGKVYYFSPRELDICVGDHVIVETARGVEYGFVVLGPKEVDDSKVIQPLKEVIRIATPKDDAREESNRKKEKEAFEICQKKIRAHNLEMKLIDAEYTFDNNKMLFYFTADGRIDFRELVKDLAAVFKTSRSRVGEPQIPYEASAGKAEGSQCTCLPGGRYALAAGRGASGELSGRVEGLCGDLSQEPHRGRTSPALAGRMRACAGRA